MQKWDISFGEPHTAEKTQEDLDTDVRDQYGSEQTYDYYRCPPDFDLAFEHAVTCTQRAHRVLRSSSSGRACLCCNYPIDGERFPLFCSLDSLSELGLGFPLFFSTVKFMLGVLALATLAVGVYCIQENYRGGREGDWDNSNEGNIFISGSLAAFGRTHEPSIIQPWLHLAAVLLILTSHEYLVLRHRRWLKAMDQGQITPSDYTIMLANVPKETELEKLKEMVQSRGRPDGVHCTVVRSTLAYDIREFSNAVSELHQAQTKLSDVRRRLMQEGETSPSCCGSSVPLQRYEETVQERLATVHRLENEVRNHFAGVVFFTFVQDEGER